MRRSNNWNHWVLAVCLTIGLSSTAWAGGKYNVAGMGTNRIVTQGLNAAQSLSRSTQIQQNFGANTAVKGLTSNSTSTMRFGSGPTTFGSGLYNGSNTISGSVRRLPTSNGSGTFNGAVGTSQTTSQFNAAQLNKFKQFPGNNGPTTANSTSTSSVVKSGVTNKVSPATVGTITTSPLSTPVKPKTAACIPPICPPHCPPHCPPYWPFPLGPIVVVTPPIIILPAPVTVVTKTVVVGKPVGVARAIDLELVGLQLVDNGNVEEQIGPRYRTWVRNNGSTAIHTEFKIAILAADGEQPKPESPNVTGRMSSIEAGQTIAIDLRLPLAALVMGRDAQGNPAPFSKLFVWIDSAQEILESSETNNATMMARGEIPLANSPETKPAGQPKS